VHICWLDSSHACSQEWNQRTYELLAECRNRSTECASAPFVAAVADGFDAIYSVAYAASTQLRKNGSVFDYEVVLVGDWRGQFPDPQGDWLTPVSPRSQAMVQNIRSQTFVGANGLLQLKPNGDRLAHYDVVSYFDNQFNVIGSWQEATEVRSYRGNRESWSMFEQILELERLPVWADGTTRVPSDRIEPTVSKVADPCLDSMQHV